METLSPPTLIDRQRSESRNHSRSRPTSPTGSPVMLRSALRDTHLHSCEPTHPGTAAVLPGHGYERRVGFDSFDSDLPLTGHSTGLGVSTSFSISAKSRDYIRTSGCRSFIVCTDLKPESWHAIEWTLASLCEDGDELIILRVLEPSSTAGKIWEDRPEETRKDADDCLDRIMRLNSDEGGAQVSLSIVVEFVVGVIEESIHRLIEVYRADTLIVGTRGKADRIFSRKYMGSISRYCVAKSPVPVIVVRPEDKVKASITARQADPERYGNGEYVISLVERTGTGARIGRPKTAPEESRGRPVSQARARTSAGVV